MLYREGDYGPKGEGVNPVLSKLLNLLKGGSALDSDPRDLPYFSSEALLWLTNNGYTLLQLQGNTIAKVMSDGLHVDSVYLPTVQHFSNLPARNSYIAINTANPFLPFTLNTRPEEQDERLALFNRYLETNIPGIRAVIGSVADYIEIIANLKSYDSTAIFGAAHGYNYTRTTTVLPDGSLVSTGCNSIYGPCFKTILPDDTYGNVGLTPLLIPSNFRRMHSY